MKEKKGASLIAIAIIILIVIAIGIVIFVMINNNKTNDVNINEGSTSTSNNTDITPNSKSKDYQKFDDLTGTVSINLENVHYCIDGTDKQIFNKGFQYINGSYDSGLGHIESYFTIYDQYEKDTSELLYNVDLSKVSTSADILYEMKNQIIAALKYPHIVASSYDYEITKQSNVTINGYKMTRFEGIFKLLYEIENPAVDYTEAKFVGYGVVKDGNPIYFIVGERPNKSNKVDIGSIADKIAKTFRDNDGNCYDD